jgi:hypothetical protein
VEAPDGTRGLLVRPRLESVLAQDGQELREFVEERFDFVVGAAQFLALR